MMANTQAERVRDLNDAFRKTLSGGAVYFTQGVKELGAYPCGEALMIVQSFNNFTLDNDPYGEHDFGSFVLGGDHFIWKIDYYDPTLQYGSKNPADPGQTTRVLTVMLAHEY